MMKVKDLIEFLKQQNPEAVVTAGQDGGWIRNMTISKTKVRKNDEQVEIILFTANGSKPNIEEYAYNEDDYQERLREYEEDIPSGKDFEKLISVEWYDAIEDEINFEERYQSKKDYELQRLKEIEAQKKYDEEQKKARSYGGLRWFQKFDEEE